MIPGGSVVGGSVVAAPEQRFVSAGTITVTDSVTTNRVYQRAAGQTYRSFTIAGTYTGSPTAIEYRTIKDLDGSGISSWTTLDAAPAGGTFSGTVNVPASAFFMNFECRFANDTGITGATAKPFGIGCVFAFCGQSNGFYWYTSGAENISGQDGVAWAATSWADVDGFNVDGLKAFGNTFNTDTGMAVGIIAHSPSSTGLVAAADSGSGYWTNFASAPYSTLDGYVSGRTSDELEGVIFIQGENDVAAAVSEATYQTALGTLVSRMRTDWLNKSAQTNLPVILVEIGTHTTANDADQQAIRNAQLAFAAATADVYMSGSTVDLPLRDAVHYTNAANYQTLAPRVAKVAAAIFNGSSTTPWPRATGWSRSGTTVTVTLAHGAGTDFTPTTGIDGFEFLDGGTPITISAAVRTNATTITLTLATSPSGAESLRYGYGANVIQPNAVVDNQTLKFALASNASIASSGVTVAIGQATETDSALGMTALRAEAIGLCTETDAAQTLAALRTAALAQASEADSAFGVTYARALSIGVAQSTDSGLAFSYGLSSSLGISTESDSAFEMTARRAIAVDIALESDASQAMTVRRIVLVGMGTEADSAFSVTHARSAAIGQATETDSSQAVLVLRVPLLGLALETDTAFSFTAPSNGTLLIGAKILAGGQQTVILLKGAGSIH